MPRLRSNPQNSFYWGVVVPAYKQAFIQHGHKLTDKECHSWLKQRFKIESTTKLTTLEWSDLLIKLQAYASNIFGVQIPDPNEHIINNLKE